MKKEHAEIKIILEKVHQLKSKYYKTYKKIAKHNFESIMSHVYGYILNKREYKNK